MALRDLNLLSWTDGTVSSLISYYNHRGAIDIGSGSCSSGLSYRSWGRCGRRFGCCLDDGFAGFTGACLKGSWDTAVGHFNHTGGIRR